MGAAVLKSADSRERGTARRRPSSSLRAEVAARLRSRRQEVEEAIATRVFDVARPTGTEEISYEEGLRGAVSAAFECAVDAVRSGPGAGVATPAALLAQARSAVRSKVGLAVVVRRYAAGYAVLGESLQRELALAAPGDTESFSALQGELTELFDRFVTDVAVEYQRESERVSRLPSKSQSIRRLLAGEIPAAPIDYQLEQSHLAVIAAGEPGCSEAEALLRGLAARLDRQLLLFRSDEQTVTAWFGGRRRFDLERVSGLLATGEGALRFGLGEPAEGISGWRLSRRQAEAALDLGLRTGRPVLAYGEIALVSSALRDEDLRRFLVGRYLDPLRGERDGGEALRSTLTAFFAAGWNASSAAARLGVTRQTVTSRLRVFEARVGRPLEDCGVEVGLALRLAAVEEGSRRTAPAE